MNFLSLKDFKGLLVLLLIDIIVIWLWAINSDLGPGSAMVIYLVVPLVVIINIILGVISLFIKKVSSPLFFINCIAAAMITYWIFTVEMRNQYNGHFDNWNFNLRDTTYTITKWNKSNDFSISYSEASGSSIDFLDGKCVQKKDTLLLINDSTRMFIHQGKLHNFRKSKNPIVLRIDN